MAGTEVDARDSIVATARHLTARKGYSAASPTEVLTGERVPKGSFYSYFD